MRWKVNPCLRRVLTLAAVSQFAGYSGQIGAQQQQPSDVVQKLYREVVNRHPLGVPYGAARTAIWPLLSKRLIKSLEMRNACDRDWERQHPDANVTPYILKPPGFYEVGLFSGGNEESYINGAAAGTAKAQADGSYLVYVEVWSYLDGGLLSLRTNNIYRWRVAARVVSDGGHFVVDDILFLRGELNNDKSIYVSKMITAECRGPHAIPDLDTPVERTKADSLRE